MSSRTGRVALCLFLGCLARVNADPPVCDYLVTSTADTADSGTLRSALTAANEATGGSPYTIAFDPDTFPTSTLTSITLSAPLPELTRNQVTIDGLASGAVPTVGLNGQYLSAACELLISGGHNTVQGLAFLNTVAGTALRVSGNQNLVQGCYVGTDGTNQRGNYLGIQIAGSQNRILGCLISANATYGLQIENGAVHTAIDSNQLGVAADGVTGMANGVGVHLAAGSGPTALGGGGGNRISHNTAEGVLVEDSSGNAIVGGGVPNELLGNGGAGIKITGTSAGNLCRHNSIAGNGAVPIDLANGDDGPDGFTPNQSGGRSGPNHGLSFPVIEQAALSADGQTLYVCGFAPWNTTVELFAGPSAGHGNTPLPIATFDVTDTSNQERGRYGSYSSPICGIEVGSESSAPRFAVALPVTSGGYLHAGGYLAATATNTAGSTSEYGNTAPIGTSGSPHHLTVLGPPAWVFPNDSLTVNVRVEDSQGYQALNAATAVHLDIAPMAPDSELVARTACDATADHGLATFSLTAPTTAGNWVLVATAPDLANGGAPLQVRPGEAYELRFLDLPSQVVVQEGFGVHVALVDAWGNTVPDGPGGYLAVNLDLEPSANENSVDLDGDCVQSLHDGVATFAGLTLDDVANGLVLRAYAAGGGCRTSATATPRPARTATPSVHRSASTSLRHGATRAARAPRMRVVPGRAARAAEVKRAARPAATTRTPKPKRQEGGYEFWGYSDPIDVVGGAPYDFRCCDSPSNAAAGETLSPVFLVVHDENGNKTGEGMEVRLSLYANPGGSTLSGTLTATVRDGEVSFEDLSLNRPGTSYVLQAELVGSGLAAALSDPFDITVGPPATLAFASPPSSGVAGQVLGPVTVNVLDSAGNPTGDGEQLQLALAANPGGSAFGGTHLATVAGGHVTFSDLTLDHVGTGYRFAAALPGCTDVQPLTSGPFDIVAGSPATMVFSQQPGSAIAGLSLSPAVTVTVQDACHNPAGNGLEVQLALAANPGSSTLGGTARQALVNGVATFGNLTLNKVGSGYTLTATLVGQSTPAPITSATFAVSAGAPSQLVFLEPPLTAPAWQTLPPVAVGAVDANGNAATLAGPVTLALGANPAGGTLQGTLTVTASGQAVFNNLVITRAGEGYTLVAGATGLSPLTSGAFRVSQSPPDLTKATVVLDQSQAVADGTDGLTLTATLVDSGGHPVPDAQLQLTAEPVGATVPLSFDPLPPTDVNGVTHTHVTATGPGQVRFVVRFLSSPLPAAPVGTFTTGAPAQLAFTQQPTSISAGSPFVPPVQVSVQDAQGRTLDRSDISVHLHLLGGGASALDGTVDVTTSHGVALFGDLTVRQQGAWELRASAPGLPHTTSATFSVGPAPTQQLVFLGSVPDVVAGQPVTGLQVALQDNLGNRVTSFHGPVTLALASGPAGASLTGTTTVDAADGVATFGGLVLTTAGAGYTLSASAASADHGLSAPFTVRPAGSRRLTFQAAPAEATAGQPVDGVQVTVQDIYGNAIADFSGTVTLSLAAGPQGATLGGTPSVAAVGGVATFVGLSFTIAGPGYVLAAASAGADGVTCAPFAVRPAAHRTLVWVAAPSDFVAGEPINGVRIALLDAYHNLATDFTGPVTLSLSAAPAGATFAGGNPTANAVGGVAQFDDLVLTTAGPGYQATATTPGAEAGVSGTFGVRPAAPSTAHSVFAVDTSRAVADGTQRVTFTLALRDAYDNPVPGVPPEALAVAAAAGSVPGLELLPPTTATDAEGRTTAQARSSRPGEVTFASSLGGQPFGTPLAVRFTPRAVDASQSSVALAPARLAADGRQQAVLQVVLRDATGQPVVGLPASDRSLASDPATGVEPVDLGSETDEQGRCQLRVTAHQPADFQLTVTAGGVPLAPVTLTARPYLSLDLAAGLYFLGLPGTPDADALAALLTTPGVQVIAWDAATQQYVPLTLASGRTAIPGCGYWVRLSQELHLSLSAVPTPDAPFRVNLSHGWNAAANPYARDLSYELDRIRVYRDGTAVGTLADQALWTTVVRPYGWLYDRGTHRPVLVFDDRLPGFETTEATVPKWSGLWLNALVDNVQLEFAAPAAGRAVRHARQSPGGGDWVINLTATAGGQTAGAVCGVSSRLTQPLGVERPPATDPAGLSLSILGSAREALAGELRPGGGKGVQTWPAEVATAGTDAVTLAWPGLLRQLPRGVLLELFDAQTGQTTLLNTHAAYRYQPSRAGEARRFEVRARYGNLDRTRITTLAAVPNRGGGCALTLTLTGPADVTLTVKGLGGRLVKALSQATGAAGTLALSWDGTDQSGRPVPRGTYLVEAAATAANGAMDRAVRTVIVP